MIGGGDCSTCVIAVVVDIVIVIVMIDIDIVVIVIDADTSNHFLWFFMVWLNLHFPEKIVFGIGIKFSK